MGGKLYGIGVGPGDPQLLTLKAVEAIHELDVVYSPQADPDTRSLALTIANDHLPEDLRIEVRNFAMMGSMTEKIKQWDAISQEIEQEMDQGNTVGFLTLGDPSTYSTYSYLLERIDQKYTIETIPGITSFAQIAAHLNQPLVLDEGAFAVIAATADADEIDQLLAQAQGIVLMKIKRHLKKVLPLLKKHGLLDKATVISNASMPNEVIYRDLTDWTGDEELTYFSTLVVYRQDEV